MFNQTVVEMFQDHLFDIAGELYAVGAECHMEDPLDPYADELYEEHVMFYERAEALCSLLDIPF